jgi:hypothetical protein
LRLSRCDRGSLRLFIDPITDIAVLGPPDDQELPSQKEDYEKLVQAALPLKLSEPAENGPAWLLSLNNNWFQCTAYQSGGGLWISETAEGIQGGMSGSPIISDGGAAIGVLCCASAGVDGKLYTHGGPNPRLDRNLPGWALSDLQITMPSKLALTSDEPHTK